MMYGTLFTLRFGIDTVLYDQLILLIQVYRSLECCISARNTHEVNQNLSSLTEIIELKPAGS